MNETEREMLMAFRQALLHQVDAIERRLEITPTTAELRHLHKKRECDTIRETKLEVQV